MKQSIMRFYLGRDKGKAVVVAAPDRANAQTMVDASTKLYAFFALTGDYTLEHQGVMKLDEQGQQDAELTLGRLQRWAQNQQEIFPEHSPLASLLNNFKI